MTGERLLMVAVLALVGFPLFSIAQEPRASLGGREFVIPVPEGYVEFCDVDEEAAALFPSFVPAQNRLLNCFTTATDLEEWRQNAGGVFRSYLIATVVDSTVGPNVSARDFDIFAAGLKSNLAVLAADVPESTRARLNQAEATISERYDVNADMTINEVMAVGAFDEGPGRISTLWLSNATHEVGDQVVEDRQVQVSSSVLLDGNVFVLFTYGNFESVEDVETYKAVAQSWVRSFIEKN